MLSDPGGVQHDHAVDAAAVRLQEACQLEGHDRPRTGPNQNARAIRVLAPHILQKAGRDRLDPFLCYFSVVQPFMLESEERL